MLKKQYCGGFSVMIISNKISHLRQIIERIDVRKELRLVDTTSKW